MEARKFKKKLFNINNCIEIDANGNPHYCSIQRGQSICYCKRKFRSTSDKLTLKMYPDFIQQPKICCNRARFCRSKLPFFSIIHLTSLITLLILAKFPHCVCQTSALLSKYPYLFSSAHSPSSHHRPNRKLLDLNQQNNQPVIHHDTLDKYKYVMSDDSSSLQDSDAIPATEISSLIANNSTTKKLHSAKQTTTTTTTTTTTISPNILRSSSIRDSFRNYLSELRKKFDLVTENRQLSLGSPCLRASDCNKAIQNSHCEVETFTCSCLPYHVKFNETVCLPPSLLGYPCKVDSQCQMKVNKSKCLNGTCSCIENYVKHRKDKCLESSKINDYCLNDSQCFMNDRHSFCQWKIPFVYGFCKCPPNYHLLSVASSTDGATIDHSTHTSANSYSHIKCVPRLGDTCLSTDECLLSTNNSVCSTTPSLFMHSNSWRTSAASNSKCECASGYRVSPNRLSCLLVESIDIKNDQQTERQHSVASHLIVRTPPSQALKNYTKIDKVHTIQFKPQLSASPATHKVGIFNQLEDELTTKSSSNTFQLASSSNLFKVNTSYILPNGQALRTNTKTSTSAATTTTTTNAPFNVSLLSDSSNRFFVTQVHDKQDASFPVVTNYLTKPFAAAVANIQSKKTNKTQPDVNSQLTTKSTLALSTLSTTQAIKLTNNKHSTKISNTTLAVTTLQTRMSSLGKSCLSSAECKQRDIYSECVDGICECIVPTKSCSSRNTGCHKDTFQCRNGQCISWYFVCDNFKNCDDGSDEDECGYGLSNVTTIENKSSSLNDFANSGKAPLPAVVNSAKVGARTCPEQAFQCSDGACLARGKICNGESDCSDGSDEWHCHVSPDATSALNNDSNNKASTVGCHSSTFACSDGQCLPAYVFCNAVQDCKDGSDEPEFICEPASRFFPQVSPLQLIVDNKKQIPIDHHSTSNKTNFLQTTTNTTTTTTILSDSTTNKTILLAATRFPNLELENNNAKENKTKTTLPTLTTVITSSSVNQSFANINPLGAQAINTTELHSQSYNTNSVLSNNNESPVKIVNKSQLNSLRRFAANGKLTKNTTLDLRRKSGGSSSQHSRRRNSSSSSSSSSPPSRVNSRNLRLLKREVLSRQQQTKYTETKTIGKVVGNSKFEHQTKSVAMHSQMCPQFAFTCANGKCRSSAIVCSGIDGCGDNSDEDKCEVCRCKPPA